MASPTTTHILALPREIRDIIYSYLYQPLFFAARHQPTRHSYFLIPRAPILSVLLTCTRFRGEYTESIIYTTLEMFIKDDSLVSTSHLCLYDCRIFAAFVRRETILKKVQHVTILSTAQHQSEYPHISGTLGMITGFFGHMNQLQAQHQGEHEPWANLEISKIIRKIEGKVPLLKTMKVAILFKSETKTYQDKPKAIPLKTLLSKSMAIPEPPKALLGMEIIQDSFAHCFQILSWEEMFARDGNGLWLEQRHRQVKIGAYTFSARGRATPGQPWNKQELIDHFGLVGQSKPLGKLMLVSTSARQQMEQEYDELADQSFEWVDNTA